MMPLPMSNQPTHRTYQPQRIVCWLLGCLWACLSLSAQAEDSWRDKMEGLIYAPRYFGPNAFPTPEMYCGKLPTR